MTQPFLEGLADADALARRASDPMLAAARGTLCFRADHAAVAN